ncbi:hypothetical protein HYV82_02870, partial [Candidatus Woesearchaeota archaeon]|nr:hypothetical protein [Candidatus Woesearchaeota archaeon]
MNSAQELEDEIRLFEGSKAAREVFGAVQEYMKTDFGSTPLEEAVHKIAEAKAALSRVGEVRKWHKRLAGKTRGGEIGGYVLSRAGEQLRAAEGLEGMVNEEAGRLFTRVKSGFRSHYNHFPNAAGEAGAGCRARLEAYAELHEQLAQQFNTKDGLLARYYAFAKDMEPIDDALGKAKAEYANTQFDQHTLLILRNSLQGILQAYSATTAAYKPFGIFPRKTPFDYSEKVAEARALAEETEFALKNCAALQHVTGLQRELSSEPASAQEAERRLVDIPRYRA